MNISFKLGFYTFDLDIRYHVIMVGGDSATAKSYFFTDFPNLAIKHGFMHTHYYSHLILGSMIRDQENNKSNGITESEDYLSFKSVKEPLIIIDNADLLFRWYQWIYPDSYAKMIKEICQDDYHYYMLIGRAFSFNAYPEQCCDFVYDEGKKRYYLDYLMDDLGGCIIA